jgi:hypothetical protein
MKESSQKAELLWNSLNSIYFDANFIQQINSMVELSKMHLFGNLRCGIWYCGLNHDIASFKSTDGHRNKWLFNFSRLNLPFFKHLLMKKGAILVDSTRGK